MLRLYTLWELERELSPEDFQHILTPEAALEKAKISYDLDYRNYTYPPLGGIPGELSIPKEKPYTRAECTVYDPGYDDLEINLMEGWIIGLDTDEYWDDTVNPFHIDADGELIFDNEDPFCWVVSDFQRAYQIAINNRNGRKPAPTEKLRPSGEPVQHAQTAKTINSKAAGRLLAAGGVYSGNIEGFRQAAQQLGGDAPVGYDQVMDNKGLLIAGVSVATGLGLGRLSTTGELEELSALARAPKPSPSELVSFEARQLQKKFKHAVDFNISGNVNSEGLKSFEKALKAHIDDPLTQKITGKYRWNQDVYHYFNPETKIDVMTKMDGNFISGWKLSETQMSDLIGDGNVF